MSDNSKSLSFGEGIQILNRMGAHGIVSDLLDAGVGVGAMIDRLVDLDYSGDSEYRAEIAVLRCMAEQYTGPWVFQAEVQYVGSNGAVSNAYVEVLAMDMDEAREAIDIVLDDDSVVILSIRNTERKG